MIKTKYCFVNILLISSLIIFISNTIIFSQENSTSGPVPMDQQYDLKDWLNKIFHKKPSPLDTNQGKSQKDKLNYSILPGVGYNPSSSVVIGAVSNASWFMGNPEDTKNSSAAASASYSIKGQIRFSVQSAIFTNKNKWAFTGDWRFWIYNQETYGLGTGTTESNAQNMDFNFLRFNQQASRQVIKNLYFGIGFDLEYYWKLTTVNDDGIAIYPNWNNSYNQKHGLDTTSYLASGFNLNALYDSRDNTINTYKGMRIVALYNNKNTALGSTSNWQSFVCDVRGFIPMNKNNTYILASRFTNVTVLNGNIPYMILPALGWDQNNTTGRGYLQGRFRGRDFMYLEIANRITLTRNRFFGIVVFANATTASDPDKNEGLFDYIKPAGGFGLRFLFDKYSRSNICIDFAIGENSSGIWFNIGEFF